MDLSTSKIGFENSACQPVTTDKYNIPSEKSMTFLCPQPTAPIDLGAYELMDDLSASFEASLLASLKEAARGPSITRCWAVDGFPERLPSNMANPKSKFSTEGVEQIDLRQSGTVNNLPIPQRTEGKLGGHYSLGNPSTYILLKQNFSMPYCLVLLRFQHCLP